MSLPLVVLLHNATTFISPFEKSISGDPEDPLIFFIFKYIKRIKKLITIREKINTFSFIFRFIKGVYLNLLDS